MTVTTSSSSSYVYRSGQQTIGISTTDYSANNTKLTQLGITAGTVTIKNNATGVSAGITISADTTVADFLSSLELKGFETKFENGRITLSHRELLGTWEENAALFNVGETVPGIVRSVEKYGIFVELAPNLAGLAEFSEGITAGCHAGVYVKSIIPSKMKIKLIIVDSFDADYPVQPPEYFIKDGHIDIWSYSPEGSDKIIETVF